MATKKQVKKNRKVVAKAAPKRAALKKAPEAPKKGNLEFEKAVRIAAWCTIGFGALQSLWSILAYGFDPLNLIIMILVLASTLGLYLAHRNGNQRIVDGLSGVVAILVVVLHTMRVFGENFFGVGVDAIATSIVVLDILMMGMLVVFAGMHFGSVMKRGKVAIKLNNRINFYILLVSVILMVLNAAYIGTGNPVELVEMLCYYCLIIAVTDVVQRLEEGK